MDRRTKFAKYGIHDNEKIIGSWHRIFSAFLSLVQLANGILLSTEIEIQFLKMSRQGATSKIDTSQVGNVMELPSTQYKHLLSLWPQQCGRPILFQCVQTFEPDLWHGTFLFGNSAIAYLIIHQKGYRNILELMFKIH